MKYSTYQENIFNWITNESGNAIIQARAGSGKTFSLIHSMRLMKGNAIAMTLNKKNAIELQEKIQGMGLINCKASTFHAEGFFNLKRVNKFIKVDNKKVNYIIDGYCQNKEIEASRYIINNLVGFAKKLGFGVDGCGSINDHDDWWNIINHYDITLDTELPVSELIEISIQVLNESNRDMRCIDFDDMIYLPLLKNIDMLKYDWVLIDEAQDTSQIKKVFTKRILKPDGRFVGIGDNKQAVYGFTGAENDSMQKLLEEYSATELSLPICYRCGKNIIKEAQTIVPDIMAKDDAEDGIVRNESYDDFIKIAQTYNLNKEDGIVCRNNAPLTSLAFRLIREGVGCRIEGRDIGQNLLTYTYKWKVKDLNTFTERLNKHFQKEFDKNAKNSSKLQLLEDKLETLIILIERCQFIQKTTVYDLQCLIKSMFSDSTEDNLPNVVVLSSIHKSKGLEFERTFILGNDQFIPSKYANQDWQLEQEENLKYVSITRAKKELVYITDVPTRRKED